MAAVAPALEDNQRIRASRRRRRAAVGVGAVAAQEVDGEGAIGLGGLCGRGWGPSGERITEDPCSALTPVTFFGAGGNDAFGFALYPRIGDRSIEPGTYELVLPLEVEPTQDALRLVLVVSPAAAR